MRERGLARLLTTAALTLTRHRVAHRRRRAVMALAVLAIAALGASALLQTRPRLVWNLSASAPIGLYWTASAAHPLARGDFVLAHPPDDARALAAERGYLPSHVPLVKRVAALPGDEICASGSTVLINGRQVAERLARDGQGRPLPGWEGCRTLDDREVFLLMEGLSGSFDGRYFGPTAITAILGKLVPLWTF